MKSQIAKPLNSKGYKMFFLVFSILQIAFARDSVAVLISDSIPEYQEPAQAFVDAYPGAVQVFQIEGNKSKALNITNDLQEDPPMMIFAIGAKAAFIAKQELPYIPMLYAMVHDPYKYGINGENVVGISSQTSAEVTLAQFRLFVPKAKTIAIFISESASIELVSNATEVARNMGYDIKLIRINSSMELRKTLTYLSKEADAIWLLPDSQIITPENFHYITSIANRSKMPILANSDLLANAGALMSVTPDRNGVGQQAADLINTMLSEQKFYSNATFLPELPRVTFNERVQRNIGLEVDPFALGFVDDLIQ
jgi:putative tryptophan/tyrosine transport system substrate-binding protein